MKNPTPKKVLLETASLLEEHGICAYYMEHPETKQMCTTGAMRTAIFGSPLIVFMIGGGVYATKLNQIFIQACVILNAALDEPIIPWNDKLVRLGLEQEIPIKIREVANSLS